MTPSSDPIAGSDWDSDWLRWLELVRAIPLESLVHQLGEAIYTAIAAGDHSAGQFLTRRLASEVTENDWSHTGSFIGVKRALCDSEQFAHRLPAIREFVAALSSGVGSQVGGAFKVAVPLARVALPRAVAQKFYKGPRLLLEAGSDGSTFLTGIDVDVNASRLDEAAALGLEVVRKILEDLRLVFYIRTHVFGSVLVEGTAEPPLNVYFSLPQPFWSKASGVREVPRIPKKFREILARLPDEEASRWNAARWHLSQAFADWAEDRHTAAAHVWQALEAFCPPGHWRNVLALVPTYLGRAVPEMGEHLATKVSLQVRELKVIGESCDWYYWVATRVPFSNWLGRVLDSRSTNCHERWSSPAAPTILFHNPLGLLQVVNRRLRDSTAEAWMQRRLEADLALLYGLRNKAVHGGQRAFSPRVAEYLAQTAAEILFGAMGARADGFKTNLRAS